MGRKSKFLYEIKMDIVKRCLVGTTNVNHEASLLRVSSLTISKWISLYQCHGENGLITSSKNVVYSTMTKQNAIEDYLTGKGSLMQICKKYQIRSHSQLQAWIKKYNNHEELKASGTGGEPIMIKGRKTTYEERITIVQYCIENQNNYTKTADKFQVSYTWMKKYDELGIDGLLDRRGRTKPVEEMSEIERLRMENRLLKAQNKRQEMEMNFLKKLDEIEMRWD